MSDKNKVISGVLWSYVQQFSTQLINFAVTLLLARLLSPNDFGVMGLIYVFIGIGNVLIDGGFSQSIIRTQDPDEKDFSTIFFSNLFVSFLIYGLLFFSAPYIAHYYKLDVLTNIIRVFSLTFIISAFSAVQNAVLTKQMKFKTQTLIAIPSIIISGVIGVSLAYFGYGVWSLVWAGLAKAFVNSIQLWLYNNWRPVMAFSKDRFRKHFDFGYKLTLTSIMDTIFVNIYPIFIGKIFSVGQVGLYTQAETLRQLPVSNITGAIAKVTFPFFASIQGDNKKLKEAYDKITLLVLFLLAPILIYMSVLAKPLLVFLFSEKWSEAAPFLEILCYAGLLPLVNSYNINIIKVKGESGSLLKIEIVNKVFLVILILVFLKFGIYGLIWSKVVSSVFSFVLSSYYCGRLINFTLFNQVKSFLPILVITVASAFPVYFVNVLGESFHLLLFFRLVFASLSGLVVYLCLVYLFEKRVLGEFRFFINKIKGNAK